MSSARHSSSGRCQDGLASDPAYVAAQGIQGTIVTKKAGILTSARARSLVFFLQALSLPELAGNPNTGGLKRWVREFLKEFPERIGTPAMHKFGMKAGQIYDLAQAREVRDEVHDAEFPGKSSYVDEFPLVDDTVFNLETYTEEKVKNVKRSYPAETFVARGRQIAERRMEDFLVSLCTDPRLIVVAPGEADRDASVSQEERLQQWPEGDAEHARVAEAPYFRDILGALFEFQSRFQKRAASDFVQTSIASQVFSTLDAGLRLQRIVLVNGLEGIGKSEAARAWCSQHLGEARYVDLTGINNKTSFFRSIARALGLPCGESLNTAQLQTRVEAMLQRSGLMLCIDEAHYLWPQSERSEAPPELVNWIDTALINRGVPVGLITTPQFVVSMQRVERKSGWNSGQFQRRIKRVAALPERPTLDDLEAVARKLLPKSPASAIKLLVGFAGSQQRHHMDALADAVKESVAAAKAAGRDAVAFADVESAVKGVLSQTALAKKEIFTDRKPPTRARAGTTPRLAGVMHEPRKGVSAPLQATNLAETSARNSTPALPSIRRGELAEV